jgi:opacity protein-like surface antigen
VFAELGYRYLQTDYTDRGFTYDVAQSGLFIGMSMKF